MLDWLQKLQAEANQPPVRPRAPFYAENMKIGCNAIEVDGAVVLQKGFLDDSLAKLSEIRGLLMDEAIQQS